jgi:hypothetical protein
MKQVILGFTCALLLGFSTVTYTSDTVQALLVHAIRFDSKTSTVMSSPTLLRMTIIIDLR